MGFIAWLCVGSVAGFVAACAVNRGGPGFWAFILVGMSSAFLGGMLANMAGWRGVQVFDWRNVLVALACAIIALIVFRISWKKYNWQFEPLPDEA